MATSLSNLVDNPTEEIHKIKYKDCDSFLEYERVKGKQKKINLKYKCLSCNGNYSSKIDEELKNRYQGIYFAAKKWFYRYE